MAVTKYENFPLAELQHVLIALMYSEHYVLNDSPIIRRMINEVSLALNDMIFKHETDAPTQIIRPSNRGE